MKYIDEYSKSTKTNTYKYLYKFYFLQNFKRKRVSIANDQRMFEIGYYAYFTLTDSWIDTKAWTHAGFCHFLEKNLNLKIFSFLILKRLTSFNLIATIFRYFFALMERWKMNHFNVSCDTKLFYPQLIQITIYIFLSNSMLVFDLFI